MSYDEYLSQKHQFPYFFSIKKPNQILYYFGEIHSVDPDDQQYVTMRKLFEEFSANSNPKKIVMVEGGVPSFIKDINLAVSQHSAPGFMVVLAADKSIPVISPEPNRAYELKELQKEFPRQEIQYYYFIRSVLQWNRYSEPKPDFKTYVEERLKSSKNEGVWDVAETSLDYMKKVHETLFQEPFDEYNQQFFAKNASPVRLLGKINEVARRSSEIRDKYIADQIVKYFQEGYSVFVVYGGTHAVVQEPYLKELLES